MLSHLHLRLSSSNVRMVFADLKPQVVSVLQATGLYARIGDDAFYESEQEALGILRHVESADVAPAVSMMRSPD